MKKTVSIILTSLFGFLAFITTLFVLMQIHGFSIGVVYNAIYAIFFLAALQCAIFYGIVKNETEHYTYKEPKKIHKLMIYYLYVLLGFVIFSLLFLSTYEGRRDQNYGGIFILTVIIMWFLRPKEERINDFLNCDKHSLSWKQKEEDRLKNSPTPEPEKEEHHHSHHHHHHHHSHEEKKEEPKTDDGKLSEPVKTEQKASSRYCHCPFCGNKIHSDSIYCKYCGKKVDEMLKEA